MTILNRWLTAQTAESKDSATPNADKAKVPVELKKVKSPTKSGIGETPEQVEYLGSADIESLVVNLNTLKDQIAAAEEQADNIVRAARKQAVELTTALQVPAKEAKVQELLGVLHDGLVKLSGESNLMFRQASGLVVALQKVRSSTSIMPSDKDKMEFITAKLKEAGKKGADLLAQLEEFSGKAKSIIPNEKDVVHMYPKPKVVKNQKECSRCKGKGYTYEKLKNLGTLDRELHVVPCDQPGCSHGKIVDPDAWAVALGVDPAHKTIKEGQVKTSSLLERFLDLVHSAGVTLSNALKTVRGMSKDVDDAAELAKQLEGYQDAT